MEIHFPRDFSFWERSCFLLTERQRQTKSSDFRESWRRSRLI